MKTLFPRSLLLGLLFLAGGAFAQSNVTQSLPEWDKLTPQQREALIAPVRERWNSDVEQRPRMLEHAQRWNTMTPDQRKQARVLYVHMVKLSPEARRQLREDWKQMSPEQRREWVQKNAPKGPPEAPLPPPR